MVEVTDEQYQEIWVTNEQDEYDEQTMCGLINGDYGWLMYLREEGDSGFSSRNPDYKGSEDETMEFYLENGQMDTYPLEWIIPKEQVVKALEYFDKYHKIPDFIVWHDDGQF